MLDVSFAQLRGRGILEFGDGYRTKVSEHGTPGFRILRVADVAHRSVRPDGTDFVRSEYSAAIGSKLSRAGDILLTTKGTVGRVAIVPPDAETVVYSPQLCYFRVQDAEELHPRFLAYWFESDAFFTQAAHRANNTDMAAYINLRDIASLSIELPNIETQRAIAEVLGALDDKIAANAVVEQRALTLLKAMFENLDFDREPGASRCALDTILEINPRISAPAESPATYLDMKNLPDRAATVRGWSQRPAKGGARFQNGDTLLARITPCLENGKVGYADFLRDGEVGVGSTEFIVLRSRPGTPAVLPYFFATSERFREYAIRHMSGTTGRQRLAASDVSSYLIDRPSDHALGTFAGPASQLMPLLRRVVDESSRLSATRDELLPLLMSGRITVRDAEALV